MRKLNLSELEWLPYAIAPGVGGEVRDVGRAVGTRNVGLRIQRIPPGARASRRHRHLFQEELRSCTARSASPFALATS